MAARHNGTLEVFERRLARVAGGGDRAATAAATLDTGLVQFALGQLEDALKSLDGAGDALRESGYQGAAAVVASIASLVARVRGDVQGAVGRAQFARGWAPPGTAAAVAGHIAVALAALEAGDRGPGIWALLEATNVLADAGLPQSTRVALAAYADWLNVGDNFSRRPRTPNLSERAASPAVVDTLARALLGETSVDRLDAARQGPLDALGYAAASTALAVLFLRLGREQHASQSIVDAHLLGQIVPPT